MTTIAIVQARMGSTRLPGKVLKILGHKPLLQWTVDAVSAVRSIDKIIVATSTLEADDQIANYCIENEILCFRGSETDVLDRFYRATQWVKADIILRFTADCPFLDPNVISEIIALRRVSHADYASNCYPGLFPDGLDCECFTFHSLEIAWQEATSKIDRECQTQFIVRNRNRFAVVNLGCPIPGLWAEHWVCDSPEDFKFCEEIASRVHIRDSLAFPPSYIDILNILDREPELREINKKSIRNERFYESLGQERLPPRTFERSKRVFERASKVIPTGANTFSKSHLQFPSDGSPLYASHGDGAYIFDVDGNRYVDLVNALLPVVLGYRDPDVDLAIRQQLDNGIVLSLGTELEAELAETLCRLIPCAEMVKFGKTGTDVTTAAVRLARAYTGRDRVAVDGYHGWADWSMSCTNRTAGIPKIVSGLSNKPSNIAYPEQYAAVVMEPTDPESCKEMREFCDKWGIVLIFDEIRTGFRYDLGGAQALYEVTPDLACFGKAMANGMPISALVGKREIMQRMETPDIYYSGTFFGETLSIAAALATIKKLESENIIGKLTDIGIKLEYEILKLLKKYDLERHIKLDGWYTNQGVVFNGEYKDQIRTLFMQTMFQNGVLIINANNLSYAIKEPEIQRILTAYADTLKTISYTLEFGSIASIKPTEAAPLRMVP